jgi:hypothetical protein
VRRRLGYLSGAPRVSTRPEADLSGPRTHVLGVIRAFESLGWQVTTFIVGDRVPAGWVVGRQTESALRSCWLIRLGADVFRAAIGVVNGWRAVREIGDVDWVYGVSGPFRPWVGGFATGSALGSETNGLRAEEGGELRLYPSQAMEVWLQECDALSA